MVDNLVGSLITPSMKAEKTSTAITTTIRNRFLLKPQAFMASLFETELWLKLSESSLESALRMPMFPKR